MAKELVMYGRRFGCWDQSRAVDFLERNEIPFRFVDISRDADALHRLQSWVGCLSVPTLLVAEPGSATPVTPPAALDPSRRIRGQDRGTMISEPSDQQLQDFLAQHALL